MTEPMENQSPSVEGEGALAGGSLWLLGKTQCLAKGVTAAVSIEVPRVLGIYAN